MGSVRVALVGVGNCASSLVQGLSYYRDAAADARVPGLMHAAMGPYRLRDVVPVCGFDVDARKVGRDLGEAIFAKPNCTKVFAPVGRLDAPVYAGPVLDGVAPHMAEYPEDVRFVVGPERPVDVAKALRKHEADVVVSYLPVGSQRATEHYAQAALDAECAFVNCIPAFIASDPAWAARFERAGLPVLGDDVKSQVGATILHRAVSRLFEERGVTVTRTYQLNVGGNTDFLNMLDRSRLASKKVSKTEAVQSAFAEPLPGSAIHVGPSDYVPWLRDNKVCFLRVEGEKFGGVPVELEIRLSVEDSPNSAGIVVDAVRVAKLALDRGVAGPVTGASAYFFKHPPTQLPDEEARRQLERFLAEVGPEAAPRRAPKVVAASGNGRNGHRNGGAAVGRNGAHGNGANGSKKAARIGTKGAARKR